jgi:23S rRNA-/tRNA-specific pseudouridylate synthase
MRLDQAIAVRFPEISRRKARELLSEHRVLVNERPVSVASREVTAADRIAIVGGHPDVRILRISDEWIAVDKPAGIPVQAGRDRSRRALDEILRVQLKRSGLPHALYVIHRIDTGTSGIVLFARTKAAAATLSRMFAGNEIRKVYVAALEGMLAGNRDIEEPIDGRRAVTHVRPLHQSPTGTIVEVEIETGRTHQIRIHCASIGHPVVGDRRYGSAAASARMMLHAWRMEHGELGTIEAPLPADFL